MNGGAYKNLRGVGSLILQSVGETKHSVGSILKEQQLNQINQKNDIVNEKSSTSTE